jgi:hypothetical protein
MISAPTGLVMAPKGPVSNVPSNNNNNNDNTNNTSSNTFTWSVL